MSSSIIPYLKDVSFDADIVRGMSLAFDRTFRELHDRGQPEVVKEVLARRIVEAAKNGVRDSERLCEIALGRKLDGTWSATAENLAASSNLRSSGR